VADTVKTGILENLETVLQGITVAGGYHRNVRTVSRLAKELTDAQGDMIFIAASREKKTNMSPMLTESTMTVFLAALVYEQDDLAQAIDEIASDITKVVSIDETRGNKAISTNVVGIEDAATEATDPLGSCLVEVEIVYRHQWGDPTATA
jgi:hypothetical protein